MPDGTWLVLPDQLSTRLFFDSGVVERLHERLAAGLALALLLGEEEARVWRGRANGARVLDLPEVGSSRAGARERVARRVDRALDRELGFYPLAIRLNYRHGFHLERMEPGHANWMLDSARVGRLPRRAWVERAMERWHWSSRRYVPPTLLERMRGGCDTVVL